MSHLHREETLRLLQRAAAALIDAEQHGPAWPGYGAALERARAFKAQADRLDATPGRDGGGGPPACEACMADERARTNVDDLFELVRLQASAVAALPAAERDGALAALHAQHERSGVRAGMSRGAALDMADRLDAWIREALKLTGQQGRPRTLH